MQVDHFNKSITTATRGINKSSTWIIRRNYEGGNDGCALHKLRPLFKKKQVPTEIAVTSRKMSCFFYFFELNGVGVITAEMWEINV